MSNYRFYPRLDSYNYDSSYTNNKDVNHMKELCNNSNNIAFNTVGFIKDKIVGIGNLRCPSIFRNNNSGLYVKNEVLNLEHKNKIRIKMLCNWCSSEQLCIEWSTLMSDTEKKQWYNLEFTHHNNNIDFFVIINKPLNDREYFIPERTIIFHMEPWCYDETQNWGVKSWGPYAVPDESVFLHVRSHRNYYNNAFWQLATTYTEFKRMPIKKTKMLSSICSSKYFDPGHIKRIDFLKYMDEKNELYLDIYNHDNDHKFKNYVGPHPPGFKDAGMLPYKYYFMVENNIEHNFITEKIWEPIISETLCFYWGCPNLDTYIDSRTYICLDLDDFEGAYNVVKTSILNDEWGKRIEFIRREKQKILDYYQFCPTLERVLIHDLGMYHNMTDNAVQYHKYFNKTHNLHNNNVCFINDNSNIVDQINQLNESNMMYTLDNVYIITTNKDIEDIISNTCKFKFFDFRNKISFIYLKNSPKFTVPSFANFLIDIYSRHNSHTNITHIDSESYVISNNIIVEQKYQTICLNLNRRPDRKENMETLFNKNNIENVTFYEAIDGTTLEITDDDIRMFAGNDFGSKKGVIGCAKSHYNIWNSLLESDCDFYLVFEDDIKVCDDFKYKLDHILQTNKSWDIIQLGYHMYNDNLYNDYRKYRSNDLPKLEELNMNNYIGSAFAYLISRSGAQKMVNFVHENGIKHGIDYIAKAYGDNMNLKQYEVVPHIVFSEWVSNTNSTVDSDIQLCTTSFEDVILERVLHRVDPEFITSCFFPYTIGKTIKNVCFIHSCYVNDTKILNSLLDLISSSKLLDTLDYVFVINLGGNILYTHDKIKIINYSRITTLCEKPTINLLYNFSKVHDCNILYLHTKGTHCNTAQVADWRNYMLFYLVENWSICLKLLNKYNTLGVNYHAEPHRHYSGNYWWTKSSYVKNKDIIVTDDRHDCEWWILKDGSNNLSLNNSEVNHYNVMYPRAIYDTEETRNNLEMILKF